MNFRERFLNLARANLNALLEKAAEQADPRRFLSGISDVDLEAELARRRAVSAARAQVAEAKARVDAPSGGVSKDRAERERAAREREAKVRAAREARERTERETRERAAKASGGRGNGRSTSSARVHLRRDPLLAKHYDVLELPYGSDFDAIKASYRRLMRKYHPDLHNGSPEKLKAATEVSQALTQAYNELERAIMGGPNRR